MVAVGRPLRLLFALAQCTVCTLCLSTPCLSGPPTQSPIYEASRIWGPVAQGAARQWLALVDYKKYSQSWNQSSVLFRESVSKSKWIGAVASVRKQVGALRTRTMKSEAYTNVIPGHIQGDYFVIRYGTVYALQGKSTETITLTREASGGWKVIGYFITPGTLR